MKQQPPWQGSHFSHLESQQYTKHHQECQTSFNSTLKPLHSCINMYCRSQIEFIIFIETYSGMDWDAELQGSERKDFANRGS